MLQECKRNNAACPAFLHSGVLSFLFLRHHVRQYLTNHIFPFGLDGFQIRRNPFPCIIKNLVGFIGVDKGHVLETRKDFSRQFFFFSCHRDGFHGRNQVFFHHTVHAVKGMGKAGLKFFDVFIFFHCTAYIHNSRNEIAVFSFLEKGLFQGRENLPVWGQLSQFFFRKAAVHNGINIPVLRIFRGVHIAGNVQVIVVFTDFIDRYFAGILGNIQSSFVCIHDFLDVPGPKFIVFSYFFKALGCVDKEDIPFLPLLTKDHDNGGNAGAVENIRWQADNGIDMVFLHQVPPDFPFFIAPEKNAVRKDDGHNAIGFQVVQVMEQEGIVRLRFRCQPKSCKPGIILFVFRIPGLRIWRVRHDTIQVQRFGFMIFIQPGPVLFQCICIPDFDIIRKYISHDQIHTGQVERIFL